MNINDLDEKLRQAFTPDRGFGIVKRAEADWQNIYFVVPPSPPKQLKNSLPYALISEALRVLNSLPQITQMNELDRLVNYLFIRREVVQSSRLEGTWSTIDHALTPGDISDQSEGKNKHQAVRSYANLLEEIIEEVSAKKETAFTTELICHIQKRIVENDPNSRGIPGKLRTTGEPGSIVIIGGGQRKENSIYNPAPSAEIIRCLNEVLGWLRDSDLAQKGDVGNGLSLPVRLAIAHSHFEAVHPFTDGNGRTGRALWPMQMICSGHMPLYLSGYVEEYKDNYGRALQEAQKKLNYIPLIEFICNAIIESDIEARKTKETVKNLADVWQARGKFRAKSAAKKSLKLLRTNPIISSSFLQKQLGVSSTASDEAIKSLVNKNIIRLRGREKRHRIYAAEELIQILSRPFGSDIDLALEKAEILLREKWV